MLADAEGCPKASGRGAVIKTVSLGLASRVINVTEAFFKARGEKWLRQNCGGNLAKDETYGFLVTDLVVGKRAPRKDAIALGEKVRKENAKVKKREKDEKARISKVLAPARDAARLAWDRELAELLTAPCENLPIPTAARCAAVLREEQRAAVDSDSELEPEPDPDDMESEARLQLAEAEAAAAAAEDELELAQLRDDRVLTTLERLDKPPGVDDPGTELQNWLHGFEARFAWSDKFPEKERRWRKKQLDHYVRARMQYGELRSAKLEAWAQADAKQRLVEFFQGKLERVQRVAAERRAADAEVEAARAALETARLQLRVEERARTRMWLEAEAELAWGADWRERPGRAAASPDPVAEARPVVFGEAVDVPAVSGVLV